MIEGAGIFLVISAMLNSGIGIDDPPPTPKPDSTSQQKLSEYARGRKLQRQSTSGSRAIIITDENLEGMASGVELTAVSRPATKSPELPGNPEIDDPREYWRGRIADQLETVRDLEVETEVLESEIASLWELFYGSDDPEEREYEIRPLLTEKIEGKIPLRENSVRTQEDFEILMKDARKSGAQPGWFLDLLQ